MVRALSSAKEKEAQMSTMKYRLLILMCCAGRSAAGTGSAAGAAQLRRTVRGLRWAGSLLALCAMAGEGWAQSAQVVVSPPVAQVVVHAPPPVVVQPRVAQPAPGPVRVAPPVQPRVVVPPPPPERRVVVVPPPPPGPPPRVIVVPPAGPSQPPPPPYERPRGHGHGWKHGHGHGGGRGGGHGGGHGHGWKGR